MVKKFRRPAAGIEEQLPSDLRTPQTLKQSIGYMINEVIGKASALEHVHSFVWDRSRGVRNDFSVQQFTDLPSLKIQIFCFERIVRFHFFSRHEVGGRFRHVAANYDHHQDAEQGFKALYSLLTTYDDLQKSNSSYHPPNEPEFRAYKILTLIPEANVDKVQMLAKEWPQHIVNHPHVQHAYQIFQRAAKVIKSSQEPILEAQGIVMAFWKLIESPETTYMLACTAEIFFQEVRKMALWTLLRALPRSKTNAPTPTNWSLNDLRTPLGLDTEEEAREYMEAYGAAVIQRPDGSLAVERKTAGPLKLASIKSTKPPAIQYFCSRLVESKRSGRSLTDIISRPDLLGIPIEDDEEETLFMPQHPSQLRRVSITAKDSGESAASNHRNRPIARATGAKRGKPPVMATPFASPSVQSHQPDPSTVSTSLKQTTPTNPFGIASVQSNAPNPFAASAKLRPAEKFSTNTFSFGQPSISNLSDATSFQFVLPSTSSAQPVNPFEARSATSSSQNKLANPFQSRPTSSAQNTNPFGPRPASSVQNANPFEAQPPPSVQKTNPFQAISTPDKDIESVEKLNLPQSLDSSRTLDLNRKQGFNPAEDSPSSQAQSLKFGPSVAQQRADQEKQKSPASSVATTIDQGPPKLASFTWGETKQATQEIQLSPAAPVATASEKATPKLPAFKWAKQPETQSASSSHHTTALLDSTTLVDSNADQATPNLSSFNQSVINGPGMQPKIRLAPSSGAVDVRPPAPMPQKLTQPKRPPVNEFGLTAKEQQRKDDCLDYITKEFFFFPEAGILDQYVRYMTEGTFEQAMKERQQKLQEEKFRKLQNPGRTCPSKYLTFP